MMRMNERERGREGERNEVSEREREKEKADGYERQLTDRRFSRLDSSARREEKIRPM